MSDALSSGPLREALDGLARLGGVALNIDGAPCPLPEKGDPASGLILPVSYQQEQLGKVCVTPDRGDGSAAATGRVMQHLMQHMLDREIAMSDCVDQMVTSYEELNMLYGLLAGVATRVNEHDVAEEIIRHAKDTLNCERVSLLVLDEDGKHLRVLAASGVPKDALQVSIPIARSVAGKVITESYPLIAGQMQDHPDLAALSHGRYDSDTFAVIRVPMQARGRPVGVLTATERADGKEFTAHDHKLLEGLSAMGAASLMNCRLHAVVNRQMISTIRALACAVDAKDRYTHAHSDRVAQLSLATARQLGVTGSESIRKVELCGLLHDIGKIGIPDAILAKPGRLTPEEFAIIKTHVSIGGRIVREVNGLEDVAEAIEHHHERYDGLGYPDGLADVEIPLTSKIIAVSDTFDSLTSNRSYRRRTQTERALQEIARCQGTQFDPNVVESFRAALARSPELALPPSDSSPDPSELLRQGESAVVAAARG